VRGVRVHVFVGLRACVVRSFVLGIRVRCVGTIVPLCIRCGLLPCPQRDVLASYPKIAGVLAGIRGLESYKASAQITVKADFPYALKQEVIDAYESGPAAVVEAATAPAAEAAAPAAAAPAAAAAAAAAAAPAAEGLTVYYWPFLGRAGAAIRMLEEKKIPYAHKTEMGELAGVCSAFGAQGGAFAPPVVVDGTLVISQVRARPSFSACVRARRMHACG
jgi:hypothetical protein